MATNYAEQIAVLQENDAETRRMVIAIQVRLDDIAKNAKTENKEMHSTYMNELSVLRADMSRLFDDLAGRVSDMRSDTEKRFTDMEKRFGELRAEMEKRFVEVEKRFGELRAEFNQSLGDLRTEMEKGLGELRAEMEKGLGELRVEFSNALGELRAEMVKGFADMEQRAQERETRMWQALNAHTKWTVGAVFTAVALFFALTRYLGPAVGGG